LQFPDTLDALRTALAQARKIKPDILILAVHQGWRKWGDNPANEINAIARAFPEFNVILGAHTHQVVAWKTVNGVAYTQAGCYGLWLGVVRLVFDTQTRRVKIKADSTAGRGFQRGSGQSPGRSSSQVFEMKQRHI